MQVEPAHRLAAADIQMRGEGRVDGRAIAARLRRALGDGHRVLREIGGGGMSRLFLVEQAEPHRLVVAKVLAAPDAAEARRLAHEGALAGSLDHPHVLPVIASGEREGIAFVLMPYVAGGTLRDRLRAGGRPSTAEVRRILREVAAALAHVHARGIVHGDVKPENVLVSRGSAVLTDFGAARPVALADGPVVAAPRPAVGTPLYMSPEQAVGDPDLGPRSDVYSFGVLAYELLTGRPPFGGPNPRAILLAHLGAPVPSLGRLRPDLPAELVTLVARALDKDPAARWADGAALVRELDRCFRPPARPFAPLLVGALGRRTVPGPSAMRARAASVAGTLAATAGGIGMSALGLAAAAAMMLHAAPPAPATGPAWAPVRDVAIALPVTGALPGTSFLLHVPGSTLPPAAPVASRGSVRVPGRAGPAAGVDRAGHLTPATCPAARQPRKAV